MSLQPTPAQSRVPPRGVSGLAAIQRGFSIRGGSHGTKFCQREPLNTTQLIGVVLWGSLPSLLK